MSLVNFSIYLMLPAVLGSTQPLTKMSTRNLRGGKWRPARKAGKFPSHLWADSLENVRVSVSHNPMGLHRLLRGHVNLHFLLSHINIKMPLALSSPPLISLPVHFIHLDLIIQIILGKKLNLYSSSLCSSFYDHIITSLTVSILIL
jgi:hypothetical protein